MIQPLYMERFSLLGGKSGTYEKVGLVIVFCKNDFNVVYNRLPFHAVLWV